jgi:hypothetical protein
MRIFGAQFRSGYMRVLHNHFEKGGRNLAHETEPTLISIPLLMPCFPLLFPNVDYNDRNGVEQ